MNMNGTRTEKPNSPPDYFCHLHLHTQYSLLDSTCKINEVMKTAEKLGQDYVAMTDSGNLYGVVDFYKRAMKNGIKPIIGCEVYVSSTGIDNGVVGQSDDIRLVLLAENNEGMPIWLD